MRTKEEISAYRRAKWLRITDEERAIYNAKRRAWHHKTKDARKLAMKNQGIRAYWRNRDKLLLKNKAWRIKNKDRIRQYNLDKAPERWGLTLEFYNKILSDQNGVCAICKGKCVKRQRLSVDHCHATNRFRGLLCTRCNSGLGQFKDSAHLLEEAARYLKSANSNVIVSFKPGSNKK